VTLLSLVLIVGAVVLLGYGLLDGSNTYLVGSILLSLLAALALVIGSRRSGGRAAVAAAVEAEELARRRRLQQDENAERAEPVRQEGGLRRDGGVRQDERIRHDELVGVGAGNGGVGSDRMPAASDEYSDRDEVTRRSHDTALIDVGRRGVPAQSSGSRGYGEEPDEPRYDYASDHAADEDDDDPDDAYGTFDDGFDSGFDDDPPGEPAPQRVSPADAARVAQLNAEVLVVDGRPRYHVPGCDHLLTREHEPLPVSEAVELGFTPCGRCEPDSALLASARRV
jgi:hypothetical protein